MSSLEQAQQQLLNVLQSRARAFGETCKHYDETERELIRTIEASRRKEDEIQQVVETLAKELRDKNQELWETQQEHREGLEGLKNLKENRDAETQRLLRTLARLVCLNRYIGNQDLLTSSRNNQTMPPKLQLRHFTTAPYLNNQTIPHKLQQRNFTTNNQTNPNKRAREEN